MIFFFISLTLPGCTNRCKVTSGPENKQKFTRMNDDVRLHPDRKINKSLPGYITKHTEKKPDENQTNFTRMNL